MIKTNQSGRSMIEMLGVLAIIGVLSVGGIAGYSKAMLKFRTNKTLDQIAMMVTNIRTLYSQQTSYSGLSHSNAYSMGITPDEMGTGTSLNDPFGGAVTIEEDTSTGGGSGLTGQAAGAFIVSFAALPREACVNIATQDWGSAYTTGFLGIGVNTSPAECTVATDSSTDTASVGSAIKCTNAAVRGPMTVSDAATACTNANTNTIYLKYY